MKEMFNYEIKVLNDELIRLENDKIYLLKLKVSPINLIRVSIIDKKIEIIMMKIEIENHKIKNI